MLFMPSLLGVLLLFTGVITRRFPPKEINDYYGYRSRASRRSQQAWDFANRYMSMQFVIVGCITVPVGILLTASVPEMVQPFVLVGETVGACLWIYFRTERAISARFDADGQPCAQNTKN